MAVADRAETDARVTKMEGEIRAARAHERQLEALAEQKEARIGELMAGQEGLAGEFDKAKRAHQHVTRMLRASVHELVESCTELPALFGCVLGATQDSMQGEG